MTEEDGKLVCKLSDFGLSRKIENHYKINDNSKFPVKWTAPGKNSQWEIQIYPKKKFSS
jgi:hypothetical protein